MSEYALEDQRAAVERHRENRARLASAYADVVVTGSGSVEVEDPIDFGLTFVERPFISTGTVVDLDELRDLLDLGDEEEVAMPLVSAHVVEWLQDDRDFFTGAYVAARVHWPDGEEIIPLVATAQTTIHFTFTAIAIKDIPYQSN